MRNDYNVVITTMAIQIDRPPSLTTQADSLAAFLSDWREDSALAPTPAAETESDHQTQQVRPSPPLPYLSATAPHLSSGGAPALRRRNKYIVVATANRNSDHGGTNGDGAFDSLATNSQPTLSSTQLPSLMLHEQGMASNASPSCARAVLHKEPSARSGGSGIPSLPL